MNSRITVAGTHPMVHTTLYSEESGGPTNLWKLMCGFERSEGKDKIEDSGMGRYLRMGKKCFILLRQWR
jgi:hypothetical protein